MLPDLQSLAIKRGHRLFVIDNNSDMLILMLIPEEKAEIWHLFNLGNVLFNDVSYETVAGPQRGGKQVRLVN